MTVFSVEYYTVKVDGKAFCMKNCISLEFFLLTKMSLKMLDTKFRYFNTWGSP